jgi:hypothetical protein
MHFLNVLYYHYFLFYKKVIKDPEPHFATVLSLSCSEALLLNGAADTMALKFYCYEIEVILQFFLAILIMLFNYQLLHRSGRAHSIIKNKPSIAGNRLLSIIVTVLFFIVTTSWLFWGPVYGKYLLSQCR